MRRSAIRHFITRLSEVLPHREGYLGTRLVTFMAGATGYAHALLLTVPPRTKVLSHWHTDREAIFVCTSGRGIFVLDDLEWEVLPGDALFLPLTHIHGIANPFDAPMEMLDFALFSDDESSTTLAECRSPASDAIWETTNYGRSRTYFRRQIYGNPAIQWVGELWVDPGQELDSSCFPTNTEKILLVAEGLGRLSYLGEQVVLEQGVAVHLVSGVAFSLTSDDQQAMRLIGTASLAGRYVEPVVFSRLRSEFPEEHDDEVE